METLTALGVSALLVRVGLALYATGSSRSKNSAAAVTRAVCDLCFVSLAFWAIGAAILRQVANPLFGFRAQFLLGGSMASAGGPLFFEAAALLTATGVVAAAMAERARFFPVAAASVLLGAVLLPVAGNWAWYGWLSRLGFVDVAGASVLHVSAGVCAVAGAILVGARNGKFNRDGSSNMIPGHSLPLASIGTLLMLVGWIPYVVGSAVLHAGVVPFGAPATAQPPHPIMTDLAGAAAADVLFAASAGGAAALLYAQFRFRKPDAMLTLAGLLGGLVAASAGAGVIGTRAAVLIGAVAGVIVPAAVVATDFLVRVDDPAGLIAVHLVGGAWGTLATALFLPGSFVERVKALGAQALGLVAIAALATVLSLLLFLALRATVGLRTREADEFDGLDLAEHDIGAYPDFQQNTIKSYHLREA